MKTYCIGRGYDVSVYQVAFCHRMTAGRIVELVHTILVAKTTYGATIADYGYPEKLVKLTVLIVVVVLGSTISGIVQVGLNSFR